MKRRHSIEICLPLIATLCLAVDCGGPREASKSPPPPTSSGSAPAVVSPVSINAEMVRIVDHAGHQLWDAERPGKAPKTDADWARIVEHATQIAAAGSLIRLEGSGPNDRVFVQQPEWQTFSTALSSAGMAALKAGEMKDQEALVAANGQLVETCESCHKRFKPALPSEGIMHVHEY